MLSMLTIIHREAQIWRAILTSFSWRRVREDRLFVAALVALALVSIVVSALTYVALTTPRLYEANPVWSAVALHMDPMLAVTLRFIASALLLAPPLIYLRGVTGRLSYIALAFVCILCGADLAVDLHTVFL